jgi:hypothetical protein
MPDPDIEQLLARIQAHLSLDRETEHELLEEIRSHLEEAIAGARAQGSDETAALAEAARFGLKKPAPNCKGYAPAGAPPTPSRRRAAGAVACAALAGFTPTAPPWAGSKCSSGPPSGP